MFRRIVIAVLSLLTLAGPCTEVLAQDFAFPTSSTYRLRGFLNSFNLQGQAATGSVSFDSEGSVTGGIITFNPLHPTQTDTKLLTVVRTGGAASGVTVQYATSNGTATAGADYVAQSGTLTFPAGATTATFTVPIVDNSTNESNETVRLTLSNPTGGASLGSPATALLTIGDNAAVVEFTGTWVGTGFEVRRTGSLNGTVTVEYAATDDTAVAGVDYAPLAGTLTFGPGVTTRLIPVRIIADTIREGPELFTLFLRNPVGARLGGYISRPMVIKDND